MSPDQLREVAGQLIPAPRKPHPWRVVLNGQYLTRGGRDAFATQYAAEMALRHACQLLVKAAVRRVRYGWQKPSPLDHAIEAAYGGRWSGAKEMASRMVELGIAVLCKNP